MSATKEQIARQIAKQRKWAEAGLCGKHGILPRPGLKTCGKCAIYESQRPPRDKDGRKVYDKERRDRLRKEGKCPKCLKPIVGSKSHCPDCLQYYINTSKRKQVERLQAVLCRGCGAQPTPGKRDCQECLDRQTKNQADRTIRLKIDTFDQYGGASCACSGCDWHHEVCGIVDVDVLTLDHIHNNGSAQRRELGLKAAGSKFYNWLKKSNYPPGFQVLCMNCNWKKHLVGVRNG